MCWAEGSGFNASAEILVGPILSPKKNKVNLSDDAADGDYNCTWSPEGNHVLYVKGTFTNGALVRAAWPDTEEELTIADDLQNFDGNPDWAPDGRPTCPDKSLTVVAGGTLTVPAECTDTGPQYERAPLKVTVRNSGTARHGTVEQEDLNDPMVYRPEPGFIGADSFQYIAFDKAGFGEPGTINVSVTAPPVAQGPGPGGTGRSGRRAAARLPPRRRPCAARASWRRSSARRRRTRSPGRRGRDVIAGLGGNDRINGLGGDDVVCAGGGNDAASCKTQPRCSARRAELMGGFLAEGAVWSAMVVGSRASRR